MDSCPKCKKIRAQCVCGYEWPREKPGVDVLVENDDGKGFHTILSLDYQETK